MSERNASTFNRSGVGFGSGSGSGSEVHSTSTASNSAYRHNRPRPRARTTVSFVNTLAPVMSRESSREDIHENQVLEMSNSINIQEMNDSAEIRSQSIQSNSRSLEAESYVRPGSPSSYRFPSTTKPGRKASKSLSSTRPPLSSKRTTSFHSNQIAGPSNPLPDLLSSPVDKRIGLKRRTSTPSIALHQLEADTEDEPPLKSPVLEATTKGKGKVVETRARSTSTSIVAPSLYLEPVTPSSSSVPPPSQPSPFRPQLKLPPQTWQGGIYITPASPENNEMPPEFDSSTSRGTSVLDRAYNIGEKGVLRLVSWAMPRHHTLTRRDSDSESEKGLSEEEFDGMDSTETATTSTARTSVDSYGPSVGTGRGRSKYWGLNDDEEDNGYFSFPPTPPDEDTPNRYFESQDGKFMNLGSLPTPALSAHSLSKHVKRRKRDHQTSMTGNESTSLGWLKHLLSFGSGSKTGEVIRELGWTVGLLVGSFVVTAGIVLWMIKGLPITQLKSMPRSTTDLQLLSAEIRAYMASGDAGWWHTVGVLTFVGCWKHAWSVPGAVVLNILVGSILEPMPALALLTIITATGSLGSYLLSRPLAPLIAVLFPKPLALVRAALAPESILAPSADAVHTGDTITPIQLSDTPTAQPIGSSSTSSPAQIWRRLLIMRAMGFVPWSGMNVACGVVGVNWRTFWLTTAAGSASWSYVTASVGNILSRLALPQANNLSSSLSDDIPRGESLTSLLRDPILIAKLVFLTLLTLLPVIIKRRNPQSSNNDIELAASSSERLIRSSIESDSSNEFGASADVSHDNKPINPVFNRLMQDSSSPPLSPITQSLAKFAPTPAAFDLLSFGRTAVRQGGSMVGTVGRGVSDSFNRVLGVVRR